MPKMVNPLRRAAAQRYRKARDRARLSRRVVASQLGVTERTLAYWEAGRFIPKPPMLKAWGEAVGLS